MADLTTIGIVTGIVSGIGALGLGIWNRIEQWRDHRERREARRRHFEIKPSPHPDNEGWRPLQFTFYNPSETAFNVEIIAVSKGNIRIAPVKEAPAGAQPYSGTGSAPDTDKSGQTVRVAWTVAAGNETGRFGIFWRPESAEASFSIRVTAREISAIRRKFHMQTDEITTRATP